MSATLSHTRDEIGEAIAGAHDALVAAQRADGSWQGVNETGPVTTAAHVVLERHLGVLSDDECAAAVRYLRSTLRDDGRAPLWHDAPCGHRDATGLWYAAMIAAGVPDEDADVRRARAAIEREGGFGALFPMVKVALALAGVLPPSELPPASSLYVLVPGYEQLLARVLGINSLMPLHALVPLISELRRGVRPPGALGQAARRRAIAYLTARQDPSGGFMGVSLMTLMAAAALRAMGVAADDDRVVRAVASAQSTRIRRGDALYITPFHSTLWDTAQLVRALLASGMRAGQGPLARAVAFLVRHQTTSPSPRDWLTPPRGAERSGGWPFQIGNDLNPDLDSSQEVLSALAAWSRAGGERAVPVAAAIDRATRFLLPMQNPDGGWAAFSHGKPSPPPGALYLPAPASAGGLGSRLARLPRRLASFIAEIGDPSAAGITGRMLYTLGLLGHEHAGSSEVRAAVAFLRAQRHPELGAWWGRWAINYLPTTSYVLTGLAAANAPLDEPWVRDAARFLLDHQNVDGGWGEDVASYEDESRAGCGESQRSTTGFVVWALSATGHAREAATRRGVRFLLEHRGRDGRWIDSKCQGVLTPRVGYYNNDTFSTYAALEGLGAHRIATASR